MLKEIVLSQEQSKIFNEILKLCSELQLDFQKLKKEEKEEIEVEKAGEEKKSKKDKIKETVENSTLYKNISKIATSDLCVLQKVVQSLSPKEMKKIRKMIFNVWYTNITENLKNELKDYIEEDNFSRYSDLLFSELTKIEEESKEYWINLVDSTFIYFYLFQNYSNDKPEIREEIETAFLVNIQKSINRHQKKENIKVLSKIIRYLRINNKSNEIPKYSEVLEKLYLSWSSKFNKWDDKNSEILGYKLVDSEISEILNREVYGETQESITLWEKMVDKNPFITMHFIKRFSFLRSAEVDSIVSRCISNFKKRYTKKDKFLSLNNAIKKMKEGIVIQNCQIDDLILNDIEFENAIEFKNCIFNKLLFSRIKFNKSISLLNCVILDEVSLSYDKEDNKATEEVATKFEGNFITNGTIVLGDFISKNNKYNNIISNTTIWSGCQIENGSIEEINDSFAYFDKLSFKENEVRGEFNFDYSIFNKKSYLESNIFRDEVILNGINCFKTFEIKWGSCEWGYTLDKSYFRNDLHILEISTNADSSFNNMFIAHKFCFDKNELQYNCEINNVIICGKSFINDNKIGYELSIRSITCGEFHFTKNKVQLNSYFNDAIFKKYINIKDNTIKGELYLKDMIVYGYFNFEVNLIDDVCGFDRSIFKDSLHIKYNTISGEASFRKLTVHRKFDFIGNTIEVYGCYFDISVFSDCVKINENMIKGEVSFRKNEFGKSLIFEHNKIESDCNFEDSIFGEKVKIKFNKIDQVLWIFNVKIKERFNLSENQVGFSCFIDKSIFYDHVIIYENLFSEVLYLNIDEFHQEVSIFGNQIDSAQLWGSRFKGKLLFRQCFVNKNIEFSPSNVTREMFKDYNNFKSRYSFTDGVNVIEDLIPTFDGDISFIGSVINGDLYLCDCAFGSSEVINVNFSNSTYNRNLILSNSKFTGGVNFNHSTIKNIDMSGASFYQNVIFDNAQIEGNMNTTDTIFNKEISLKSVFINSFLLNLDQFNNHTGVNVWKTKGCKIPEIGLLQDKSKIEDLVLLDDAEDQLLTLKQSFNSNNMTVEEDWAYYLLMNCKQMKNISKKKKEGKSTILNRLNWFIFEKAFGWGVRLSFIGRTSIFVTLFFLLILFLTSIIDPSIKMILGPNETALGDMSLYRMVMISLQSFANILLGNWTPAPDSKFLEIIFTCQGIVGIVMITFLIGAYTRKVLR